MVLDHHDDRALVDGEKSVCVPALALSQNASTKPNSRHRRLPCRFRKCRSTAMTSAGAYGRLASAAVGLIVPLSLSGACAE